jgi:autoinducer 2-degrading protein
LSKLILKGHIVVPFADLAAVKNEFTARMALTKKENGCLVFEASQDVESPSRFTFYEEFTNRESFSKHQDRPGTS